MACNNSGFEAANQSKDWGIRWFMYFIHTVAVCDFHVMQNVHCDISHTLVFDPVKYPNQESMAFGHTFVSQYPPTLTACKGWLNSIWSLLLR